MNWRLQINQRNDWLSPEPCAGLGNGEGKVTGSCLQGLMKIACQGSDYAWQIKENPNKVCNQQLLAWIFSCHRPWGVILSRDPSRYLKREREKKKRSALKEHSYQRFPLSQGPYNNSGFIYSPCKFFQSSCNCVSSLPWEDKVETSLSWSSWWFRGDPGLPSFPGASLFCSPDSGGGWL